MVHIAKEIIDQKTEQSRMNHHTCDCWTSLECNESGSRKAVADKLGNTIHSNRRENQEDDREDNRTPKELDGDGGLGVHFETR